jgi:tRNA nucleotidyltransferase/poly(A) polymerase
MADYIYLLQTRLTPAQQSALQHVRDAARTRAFTVFLVGGAVRDLTTGAPIRDLDLVVQGNALKLKKDLEKAGGKLIGENEDTQSLYFNFPGGVRLEVGATLSATFPKPGKPVYKASTILEDLRRRDFTANAMAISLNEGSYGLLMDPLNGIGDLENRELRLVSTYGFIEDPVRMIRAMRFSARLGWQLEDRTRQRYDVGKTEGYISAMSSTARGYELEEIFHEEDPLRVLRRLEHEGWAKLLTSAWTSKQAAEGELNRLRDTIGQLEAMGIHPDPSPAMFPLLTAKAPSKNVAALKRSFARHGFAAQIGSLESETKAFASRLSSKAAAAPSDAWKMIFSAPPESVLWLVHTSKTGPLAARFKAFFNDWSQARTKIPYQLMQEMRIVPELPIYNELLDKLFFALMDNKLDTPEAARAFLEPYSPPAPPPPVNLRRRAVKREPKPAKSRSKKAAPADETTDLTGAVPSAAAKPAVVAKAAPAKASAAVKAPPAKSAAKPVASKPAPAKKAVAQKPSRPAKKKAAPKKAAKKAAKKLVKKAVKKAIKKPSKPAKKPSKTAPKKIVKKVAKKPAKPTKKKPAPKSAKKKSRR